MKLTIKNNPNLRYIRDITSGMQLTDVLKGFTGRVGFSTGYSGATLWSALSTEGYVEMYFTIKSLPTYGNYIVVGHNLWQASGNYGLGVYVRSTGVFLRAATGSGGGRKNIQLYTDESVPLNHVIKLTLKYTASNALDVIINDDESTAQSMSGVSAISHAYTGIYMGCAVSDTGTDTNNLEGGELLLHNVNIINKDGVLLKQFKPYSDDTMIDVVSGSTQISASSSHIPKVSFIDTDNGVSIHNISKITELEFIGNKSDGHALLKCILDHNDNQLHKVKIDVGNVNGTYADLIKISKLNNAQLISHTGTTYSIDEWVTQDMINEAKAIYPELNITFNEEKIIPDWNELAVQTLRSDKPNYNPAVAIILHNNGKGNIGCRPNNEGNYFITKKEVSEITSISTWFKEKTTLIDNNKIVNESVDTYIFNTFNEFKYFINVTSTYADTSGGSGGGFSGSNLLEEITLPTNMTTINGDAWERSGFVNCSSLRIVHNSSNLTTLGHGVFSGCSNLEYIDVSNVTTMSGPTFSNCRKLDIQFPQKVKSISAGAFQFCVSLKFNNLGILETIGDQSNYNAAFRGCTGLNNTLHEFPSTLKSIGSMAFADTNLGWIHLNYDGVVYIAPGVNMENWKTIPGVGKIYIGDGSSAEHDNSLLDQYLNDSTGDWKSYSSRLDTWYNYLHPAE